MTFRRLFLSLTMMSFLGLAVAGCEKKEEATPTTPAPAENGDGDAAADKPAAAADKPAVELAANTKCPVGGEDIDKEVSTLYKGKTVYFCCDKCIEKFNAEPEKFVAKLPQFKDEGGESAGG